MPSLGCLLDIKEELSSRWLWIEGAQDHDRICAGYDFGETSAGTRLYSVFTFIVLDEITMEMCGQKP